MIKPIRLNNVAILHIYMYIKESLIYEPKKSLFAKQFIKNTQASQLFLKYVNTRVFFKMSCITYLIII